MMLFYLIIVFFILLCIYALIRNQWVYDTYTELVWTDYEKYKQLPPYQTTMFKYFFIWNIEKLIEYNKGE